MCLGCTRYPGIVLLLWRSNGKPRQGEEFESMRQTRLQFKYALRYIKQHEHIMRKDSLAKKLAMSDPTKFWSEIRTMSGQNNTLPSCVEGVSGMGRRLHFEHLFNCVHDPERNNMSFNSEYNDDIVVTMEEVVSAVQKLDRVYWKIIWLRWYICRTLITL